MKRNARSQWTIKGNEVTHELRYEVARAAADAGESQVEYVVAALRERMARQYAARPSTPSAIRQLMGRFVAAWNNAALRNAGRRHA